MERAEAAALHHELHARAAAIRERNSARPDDVAFLMEALANLTADAVDESAVADGRSEPPPAPEPPKPVAGTDDASAAAPPVTPSAAEPTAADLATTNSAADAGGNAGA
ncbi:MAG TPA: hypothetical protein VEA16_07865 [Vicinamibacterales bacterium]|nr:hypothetical protein [Vicinamibacterales bacterium]